MTQVLCVTRTVLNIKHPKDTKAIYDLDFTKIKYNHLHFIDRSVVDSNEPKLLAIAQQLPQVLPYVVVKYKDNFLTYSRAKGAESRLHGKLSLGFGGHIDLDDLEDFEYIVLDGVMRELMEELNLDVTSAYFLTNMSKALVDTTNDVGSVHLGLLYVLEIDELDSIDADENEISLAEWQTLEQIQANKHQYENWSQLVIDDILPTLK